MADIVMTKQGYEEALKRFEYLTKVKRAEIIARIQEARSHGDLSENAEYDAARNEQAANESEILELDFQIKNARIIEETGDSSVVHIGSRVTVEEVVKKGANYVAAYEGETETYTIRGTTEVNVTAEDMIISNESPMGKALLGRRVGDVVTVVANDTLYFRILKTEN